jgi:phenylacetate-CoA ligase
MINNIKAMWQVMSDLKLPADKKEELVKKRLKKVLVSAYEYVPYYRNIMKQISYNPIYDYKGPEDLKIFPITSKQDIKVNDPLIFLKGGVSTKNLYLTETTGSTGILLKIFLSPNENAVRTAKWLRVLFINQYSIRNKVLSFVSPSILGESKTLLQKLGFLRRNIVDELLDPEKLAEAFLIYKPHVLYGGRSPIDLLAMELIKLKVKPDFLKMVFVGGEIVHEHNRNLYKQAFCIDAMEYYGSEEMGIMAYETPAKDGLHFCDDYTYFEFLDKNNNPALPGEPARIVVTDLIGTVMPFIRYEQGDIVTIKISEGPNGKPERRILKIIGRDNDFIILPDGKRLFFSYFYNIISKFDRIWQFKLIQDTNTHYRVIIAASQDYFNEIESQIKDLLIKNFPKNCHFDLLRVDHMQPEPNGKLCFFVSKITDNK